MATQWHYTHNGTQHGPVSSEELRQLAAQGELLPTDTLWKKGMAKWVPASTAKGLFTSGTASQPRKTPREAATVTKASTVPRAPTARSQKQNSDMLWGAAGCILIVGLILYTLVHRGVPSVFSVGGNIARVTSPEELDALRNAGWTPNVESEFPGSFSFGSSGIGERTVNGIRAAFNAGEFRLWKSGDDKTRYKSLSFSGRSNNVVVLGIREDKYWRTFCVDPSGNRTLRSETFYEDAGHDVRVRSVEYFGNGSKSQEEEYDNDKLTRRIGYYENGHPKDERIYVRGVEVKRIQYDENDKVVFRLDGDKTTTYFPNGQIEVEFFGDDARDVDPRNRYWDKDGQEVDADEWLVSKYGKQWQEEYSRQTRARIDRNVETLRRNMRN